MTGEWLRRGRRLGLFALAGAATYLVALMFGFPYDRARELAVARASQMGYELEIGSAGPSFPFGMLFEDVRVRGQPPTPGAKAPQAWLESVRVGLLELALSHGESADVHIKGLGGEVSLRMAAPKKGPLHVDLEVKDINIAQLPGVREHLNLPLVGTLDLTVRLDSTSGRFADSHGEVRFKCGTCIVGDGKSAVKFGGGNAFLAGGLTLPRLRLGDVVGRAAIEKGTAKLQGVESKSADAEMTLEGEVNLADPIQLSRVNAYLRFKLGDTIMRGPIGSILQVAGAAGKRPDGFYGLRLAGVLSAISATLATSGLPGSSLVARPPGIPAAMPSVPPPPSPPPPVPVAVPPPPPTPAPEPPAPAPPPAPPPHEGAGGTSASRIPVPSGLMAETVRGTVRGLSGSPGPPGAAGAPGSPAVDAGEHALPGGGGAGPEEAPPPAEGAAPEGQ